MTEPLGGLLSAPPAIVAAGVDVFSDALRVQGADVHDVDWRPPAFGSESTTCALRWRSGWQTRRATRTAWPAAIFSAAAKETDVRPDAPVSLRTATSAVLSVPTTVAVYFWPVDSTVTVMLVEP